jgi:hemerythrin superfamily protein
MPDGIDLILADHEAVNALFAEFATSGRGSPVGQIIDALKAHDEAEHFALYPLAAKLLGDAALLERAQLAHSRVKRQIDTVAGLEGPALTEAVRGLQALVDEHVADEEANLLPALRSAATADDLDALAARILQIKQRGG